MTRIRTILFASVVATPIFIAPAMAAQLVTYNWTTTSEGFNPVVGEPSTASFQAPLADVLNGVIPQFDVTNIQLAYPGLTFDTFTTSSTGFDFAAFVNPTTGAFIVNDPQEGFAVFASNSTQQNTFLSITVDNPYSPFGVLQTTVADQFNALNQGNEDAGFPTAGFWTASFPTISAVPEASTWAMLLIGFGGIGFMARNLRRKSAATA